MQDILMTLSASLLQAAAPSSASEAVSLFQSPLSLAGISEPLVQSYGENEVWVRGHSYKVGFTTAGAEILAPVGKDGPLGAGARFELASAVRGESAMALDATPRVTAAAGTVTLHHGALLEVHHLGLDSIEQTFVLDREPAGKSDLVLRIAVDTPLEARVDADGGFTFHAEGLGLRHGAATVLDARGQARGLDARWLEERAIELTVPAEFLAGATYPVVVDPVIGFFQNSFDADEDIRPDVAWSDESPTPEGEEFLMVWEDPFDPTESDVYFVPVTMTGSVEAARVQAIDLSSRNWQRPVIAFQPGKNFGLVAAEQTLFQGGQSTIQGVFFRPDLASPSGYLADPPQQISTTQFESRRPDVSASAVLDPSNPECLIDVVYETVRVQGTHTDIAFRRFRDVDLPTQVNEEIVDANVHVDQEPRLPDWSSWIPSSGTFDLNQIVWTRRTSPVGGEIWRGRISTGTSGTNIDKQRVTAGPTDSQPVIATSSLNASIAFTRKNLAGTASSVLLTHTLSNDCNDPTVGGCGLTFDLRVLEGQEPGRLLESPEFVGSVTQAQEQILTVAYVERLDLPLVGLVGRIRASVVSPATLEPDMVTNPTGLRMGFALLERSLDLNGPLLADLDRPRGCSSLDPSLSSQARPIPDEALFAFEDVDAGGLRGAIVDPDGLFPRTATTATRKPVGRQFCQAEPNSTGERAWLRGTAINLVISGSISQVQIDGLDLPTNQFVMLINGPDPAFIPNPGTSTGNLCLGGGIGRELSTIQSTGAAGQVSIVVDPNVLARPMGPVSAMPLETWGFQLWYRDAGGTSNFSNAIAVTWR